MNGLSRALPFADIAQAGTVLFVLAQRHSACDYVQGMNDLEVPCLRVVIADKLPMPRRCAGLHHIGRRVVEAARYQLPSRWPLVVDLA